MLNIEHCPENETHLQNLTRVARYDTLMLKINTIQLQTAIASGFNEL